jgi:hypothetical protein
MLRLKDGGKKKMKAKMKKEKNPALFCLELTEIRQKIKELKEAEELVKEDILDYYESQITAFYEHKGTPFGVAGISDKGFKFSFETPKIVSWDQNGLRALANEGAPVSVKYNVTETTFNALDEDSQAAFMPYRTVKPGKIVVDIELVGE